jgi:hypothetical protein
MVGTSSIGHHTHAATGVLPLSQRTRDRLVRSFAIAALVLLAACGSTVVIPVQTHAPSPRFATAPSTTASPAASSVSASPTANTTGFAFAADDIAAYYESQGYTCATPQPSAKAAGYTLRTCQQMDPGGRMRVIGLVTDPDGGLANAFASVRGRETETILAPVDALDPLAGFLGATLGEERGSALLSWLASHLGDTYAQTVSEPVTVATYTESADDHSALYVEVGNRGYLDAAPPASPSG